MELELLFPSSKRSDVRLCIARGMIDVPNHNVACLSWLKRAWQHDGGDIEKKHGDTLLMRSIAIAWGRNPLTSPWAQPRAAGIVIDRGMSVEDQLKLILRQYKNIYCDTPLMTIACPMGLGQKENMMLSLGVWCEKCSCRLGCNSDSAVVSTAKPLHPACR